jgi:hypothetical protein
MRMTTAAILHKMPREARALIASVVREVLDDPDFGLKLTPTARRRLRAATRSTGKTVSLADIRKRYR